MVTERHNGHPAYNAMGGGRTDYMASYRYDERQDPYGLHCHDFFELYVHFSGGEFYCIDNKVFPMRENQLYVLPPFCLHGLFAENVLAHYRRGFLYIAPSTLSTLGLGQIDLVQFLTTKTRHGQYQFAMTEEDAKQCEKLFVEIDENMQDGTPLARFSNHVRMVRYLEIVCRTMQAAQDEVGPMVVNEAVQEVLSYVNDHFTQPLRLEELARRFGVSVSYLSHAFIKYTGRSVYDYVLYRRVQLARELVYSDRALGEVAYQCGFGDYSGFLRAFQKMTGMSPSAYRKQVRSAKK